ncbi:MAG: DUF4115 domain-containing protein [Ignavibacteria bacterium]|nr:DUF4115 domain-containing protein [Ignavibacteria bacterium]
MENISEIIRTTRESKKLTLEEVSIATKIRVNVLKAIEDGNFHILPKIYMYSFLKEYIRFLGLKFEDFKPQVEKFFKKENVIEEETEELTFYKPLQKRKKAKYTATQLNKALYFIYSAIFLSFLAIIYFTFFYEGTEQTPLENLKTPDTLIVRTEQQTTSIFPKTQDSIKLEFYAKDTVWINMVIDNKVSEKLILYPNTTKVWSAGNFFRFTLGNAGGVTIKRDGIELPQLTKEKVVIKNILVTRDKFYIEPIPKPKPQPEQPKQTIILSPSEIKREMPLLRDTKKIKPN